MHPLAQVEESVSARQEDGLEVQKCDSPVSDFTEKKITVTISGISAFAK